jgi:predicted TIM-barrel fold metal-dependent hydrolase
MPTGARSTFDVSEVGSINGPSRVSPIIDIHTHCAARTQGDPFGVAERLRGISAGKHAVTNYRGLPAVSYREMSDFDLQQEVCAKAGITGRIISNPFAAEVMAAIASKPAIDVVKHVNDQNAAIVARVPATNWGLGTLNPLEASHIAEGERCLGPLGFKGLLITSSWQGRFLDTEAAFPFWEWAQDRQAPIFIHPPRVPIGHDQQMDQYKLDELVGRPFDTAMALARMILSGLFDRYPRLKIAVAHMGGGIAAGHGTTRFRLAAGLRRHARARRHPLQVPPKRLPRDALRRYHGVLAPACARSGRGVRGRPRDVRYRLRTSANRSQGAHRHRERTCDFNGRQREDSLAQCRAFFRTACRGLIIGHVVRSRLYSVHYQIGRPDHRGPFLDFAWEHGGDLRRCLERRGNALFGHCRAHRILRQRGGDAEVEPLDNRRWRARRREQSRPGISLSAMKLLMIQAALAICP